jgi:hypothetical protein
MEAELATLDTATVEAKWLRELLMDLLVVEKPTPAILMNCDNQTVIAKVTSSKDNGKCWGLVLKCYELRTRQHKMLNIKALRPSKHYFPLDIMDFGRRL